MELVRFFKIAHASIHVKSYYSSIIYYYVYLYLYIYVITKDSTIIRGIAFVPV